MSLEKTLMVFGIFIIFLTAYGAGVASLDLQGSLNAIFAPVPSIGSVFVPIKGCGILDINCNAQNVGAATANIALSIEYPGILAFTIIGRIVSFVTLINQALFGSLAASSTVPFLELFELVILLGGAVEVFRLVRGNSSGSTL